ncbi:MAG: TIGR03960 family B12-binding radical SAM protein [Lachnospiraceae bacterium]|jgi:radical SAM family uncharacterized protein|nr:TIGR03960 family B12-binding radical SAM protein [Lachnospiraceae bacterium]MCH4064557.1 TIGR03960 family B12-binding radical SAM protein [Lachnospiraceae bacterium]MCH4104788.1 TIGR03960 family B12-binding radical SAM protein [Lachnospiraceae bacterium]MCI1308569.1 TIGR03960 family B12-binding radical SAM protein [Lachnospiraceae bacterium]MCI1333238.1 TIGR03960 family B12-binding radical SAM protein [Lachnospiraceae bacterium]
MREPVLSDRILLSVEKPARYIGNELNSVQKDKDKVDIRFAMCFPDVYEIGMSHLGIQIIYEQLNRRADTWCERVYSPWPDLADIMKKEHIPLFALESQEPVRNFDWLGITLQYELCYTNVLQVLDLAGIPFLASEREDGCPIVMGGGPCTYNPEPIAPFFDLFYIGESETVMDDLMDLYKAMKKDGYTRNEFIHRAAVEIPGIYAPNLYEISYDEDGFITERKPLYDDLPKTVSRQVCTDMTHAVYPEKPLVGFIRPTQDRVVLEIQRGCIRGCRFCQAGMIYRPLRERSLEVLEKYAAEMLKETGQEEISLSSLSSSDYRRLPELLDFLIQTCDKEHVNISLPSLRIDNFSLDIMKKVQDVRKSSLTFAPEAGTQRLRDVINKGLTEEEIIGGADEAFRGGWNKVKLYFMLGLPTETDEDRKGIAHLAEAITEDYFDAVPKEKRMGSVDITVSTSFFVPKPFTPLQWTSMHHPQEYIDMAHTVRNEIRSQRNQKRIHYKWHEADGTELEGIFARGDRRIAPAIVWAYEHGAVFDAWTDYFNYQIWLDAFKACGVDTDFYTVRKRSTDEPLPWDFIDVGVSKRFMVREWEKATGAEAAAGIFRERVIPPANEFEKERVVTDQVTNPRVTTPNCREACSGCGALCYGTGVCYEKRTAGYDPTKRHPVYENSVVQKTHADGEAHSVTTAQEREADT